jgi:molybdopterin synthase catalytic subunit
MVIEILQQAFDPWKRLDRFQRGDLQCRGRCGATAVFVGTMRDLNEGLVVEAMTLEHYPEMSEKYLAQIGKVAQTRWDLFDILMVHRVGQLAPNDTIVLVAVWSAHRAEAFAACRYLIEALKSRAPFWKKERSGNAERWVVQNTSG